MPTLAERFRAHVSRRRLFPRPGTALVAVSGGPDSVALLDLLTSLPDGPQLVVAHVDHGIQPGSDTVAASVRRLAARYGVPCACGSLALGERTTETAARRARYAWLEEVRSRVGADWLVTAHHRDDQVETILLRTLRGSAPAGLAGMAARTRLGARVRGDLARVGKAAARDRRAWDSVLDRLPDLDLHAAAESCDVARPALRAYDDG